MSTADDEVAKASCRLGCSCPTYGRLSMLGMDFRSSFPTASLFQGENELLKCFSPESPLECLLAIYRNVFRRLDEQFQSFAAHWGCRDTNVVADENTVVRIDRENQHFFLLDWAVFCTPGIHRSRAWRMIAMLAQLANSSFLIFSDTTPRRRGNVGLRHYRSPRNGCRRLPLHLVRPMVPRAPDARRSRQRGITRLLGRTSATACRTFPKPMRVAVLL
jgi:hypothetical protein